MLLVGSQLALSWIYYVAILGVMALFLYQQYLIRDREPEPCLQAFLNNNWVGAVLFFALVGHYHLLPAAVS